jgi:phosphoribosylformimino-5-aminoimidazole carboxamide ribonucleotide (ProFAR) isomerase
MEMLTVIVFPAIDLRRGKCVRLIQGEPDAETVYGDDPLEIARQWMAAAPCGPGAIQVSSL